MDLKVPISLGSIQSKLRGKGRLMIATCCALTATTMAITTFVSGSGGGLDELCAAEGSLEWSGPVGLLDSDYKHLVTVGKITRAGRADEYVADELRDPMTPPKGALKSKRPAVDDSKAKAPAPTTLPNMWLSGIIWDPENPIVMIDGLDLRVGDRIKGARVVEIRIDSVVLSYASKQYVLTVD